MGTSIWSSSKLWAEPRFTSKYKPAVWASPVLKRVLRTPSRALAGTSELPEGALVLASQPVRARMAPLSTALQLTGGNVVLVVDDVVEEVVEDVVVDEVDVVVDGVVVDEVVVDEVVVVG